MEVLRWMGENWLLSIILASMASETIIRIFKAGTRKAVKCRTCGGSP
jgi:hypothetical protein